MLIRSTTICIDGGSRLGISEQDTTIHRPAHTRRVCYWSAVGLAIALILTVQPVFAVDTIWTQYSASVYDARGILLL